MITLEGYEIEEMRSINHIMTVELQFKTPMTQKEARDYLFRVLAKANELEAQAQKEDVKEYLEKTKNSLEELTFAFPQKEETANESLEIANENPEIANDDVINEENLAVKKKQIANAFGVPESVLDVMRETQLSADPIHTSAKRIFEETAKTAEMVKKLDSAEPAKGVLKFPITEEEIAGMKQKKLEEKPKKIDWDKACALKKAGWSNKQIAEELHANRGTIEAMIYKHLEKYNAGERKAKYEEKA